MAQPATKKDETSKRLDEIQRVLFTDAFPFAFKRYERAIDELQGPWPKEYHLHRAFYYAFSGDIPKMEHYFSVYKNLEANNSLYLSHVLPLVDNLGLYQKLAQLICSFDVVIQGRPASEAISIGIAYLSAGRMDKVGEAVDYISCAYTKGNLSPIQQENMRCFASLRALVEKRNIKDEDIQRVFASYQDHIVPLVPMGMAHSLHMVDVCEESHDGFDSISFMVRMPASSLSEEESLRIRDAMADWSMSDNISDELLPILSADLELV